MTNEVIVTDVEVKPSGCCCFRRCSMPSFSRMPTAARNFMNNMFSFLHNNQAQTSVSDKTKTFSTPQVDRKRQVNGNRRNSESEMNAKTCGKRIYVEHVESWEPSVTEKELLRRTWSDEFDFLYNLGADIYTYIFDHNPNCKKLFPYVEKYGENWRDCKEFRSQALKFVQTLAQVVKNLYHMDRLEPYLYGIGQKHCKFADRGFKPEYWDIFQDAMEHSLSDHMYRMPDMDENTRAEAVKVWRTLALYVIAHMRKGYLDGLKSINAHKMNF